MKNEINSLKVTLNHMNEITFIDIIVIELTTTPSTLFSLASLSARLSPSCANMELDPFLALEDIPTPDPSSQQSAAAADNVDPLASILGDDHHESAAAAAAPSAATSVVIDRSSGEEKPAVARQTAVSDVGASSSVREPVGQGERCMHKISKDVHKSKF